MPVFLCLWFCEMSSVHLRLLAVHVECCQLIVHKFYSHSRQRGLLLKLADGPLDVLHDHLCISAHADNMLAHSLHLITSLTVPNAYM